VFLRSFFYKEETFGIIVEVSEMLTGNLVSIETISNFIACENVEASEMALNTLDKYDCFKSEILKFRVKC